MSLKYLLYSSDVQLSAEKLFDQNALQTLQLWGLPLQCNGDSVYREAYYNFQNQKENSFLSISGFGFSLDLSY